MNLVQIAHISNGFIDKFGIPRQSREESVITSRIVFEPEFRVREALRGIEEYSHLWLIWEFSELNNASSGVADSVSNAPRKWSPTVRPPRLGGNTRMGVFATRSPYRPNPLGLTSVKLLRVEETKDEGMVLVVSGADLLDGTPIYDIKPYLSFSDAHVEAKNGFAEATRDYRLRVEWGETSSASSASETSGASNSSMTGKVRAELEEILSQDPRPAYQEDATRVYKLDYAGVRVAFRVENDTVYVVKVERIEEK